MTNVTKSIESQVADLIAVVERENRKFNLVYIDYRDSLTGDQVREYLDTGYVDSFYDTEWFYESRWEGLSYVADDLLREFDVTDNDGNEVTFYDLIPTDSGDDLRDCIEDRDESDTVQDLISNTGPRLFRVPLGAYVEAQGMTDYDPTELALDIAQDADLDPSAENLKALAGILAEQGYYGGEVVALVRADIETMRALKVNGGTIVDPEIWIYDGFNGTCFGDTITGLVEVAHGEVELDEGPYSIDGICGLYHVAFQADVRPAKAIA